LKTEETSSKPDADGEGHSLPESYRTVSVPHSKAGFWRQWLTFSGPAILISVGYMDPGNWGTDLAGGAQFKYGLLWVVALASSWPMV
jgi:manganese transport protein